MENFTNIFFWAEVAIAFFVLLGATIALLATSGLLRFNSFFARAHAPALVATVGIWCVMVAAIIYFSIKHGELSLNMLLISLFISITAPVVTIFIMRAALFRARLLGQDVPPSVSRLALAEPQEESEEDEGQLEEESRKESEKTAEVSIQAKSTGDATKAVTFD